MQFHGQKAGSITEQDWFTYFEEGECVTEKVSADIRLPDVFGDLLRDK
jgi:hypothetical protein